MITQDRLKQLVFYNEINGQLIWLGNKARAIAGDEVGCKDAKGYIVTSIDGVNYKVHRLIWLYIYGIWPEGVLDHIDGNTSNNILCNLRDVSQMVNGTNRNKLNKNNTSGFAGVYKDKTKWAAELIYMGEKFRLGNYVTPEEAHESRIAFIEEYKI